MYRLRKGFKFCYLKDGTWHIEFNDEKIDQVLNEQTSIDTYKFTDKSGKEVTIFTAMETEAEYKLYSFRRRWLTLRPIYAILSWICGYNYFMPAIGSEMWLTEAENGSLESMDYNGIKFSGLNKADWKEIEEDNID